MTPGPARSELPEGTLTFLFTDIEGSTRLLQELGEEYRRIQDDHAEIMRKAIAEGDGVEVRTEGDSFFAVFPSPAGALGAAVSAQRGLAGHPWLHREPLRVRMGMHTGEGVVGGDDYLGIDVNRAARIAAAAHGGQVLLSDATRALVQHSLPEGMSLRDLGEHRLKDIVHPERLHDVAIEGLPSEYPPPRTLDVPWNVPSERTRFIGRQREVAAVADLVRASRLVTITGSGGSGKTRLAIQIAASVRDEFADGVVFVDLAPLADPGLVPSSIAAASGIQEEAGVGIEETLRRRLADREALLILDNFEHLTEAARVVSGLLDAAPALRSLVTSRVSLHLSGEQEFPVPPMAVPPRDAPVERLTEGDAVALFVERARAVDPAFTAEEEDIRSIAELCARLDGLPLAIELAASRVRALSPTAILERLGGRLHLLGGGPRDAPRRHSTLAEAIRWSDELLDDAASTMLRRLSVFAGGWALEAADAVANPEAALGADTLDLTEMLLEHGLIRRYGERFRMLETVRAYAAERVGEEGEDLRRRHARFFLDLAERAESRITSPFERDTLADLGLEHDNLRTALRWSAERDLALGLRLGSAIWRFWQLRGHLAEGRATMERLLGSPAAARPELGAIRARGLVALASVVYWQNDFAASRAAYEEALALARDAGADEPLGDALYGMAFLRRIDGDLAEAASLHEAARQVYERLGDDRRLASATMSHGMLLTTQRDLDEARSALEDALRRFTDLGDLLGAATCYGALAQVSLVRGDDTPTVELSLRSIELGQRIGDDAGIAVALEGLATLAVRRGDHETAVLLAASGEEHGRRSEARAPAVFLERIDAREAAEPVLGRDETDRLWARGLGIGTDAAVELVRARLLDPG
jgi:predicted ATPase/class 3 adenylate cyclase